MGESRKMKVTIVVGGRWHAFDLARELDRSGHLHKLITNYPQWFVRRWGIQAEKVVSLPLTFWIVKLIYRIGGESLMMQLQWTVHSWFAKRAAKHLDGSELIHGWSQWSEPSLLWAKEKQIPTVLERSSAQIQEQGRLLREEHNRLGIKWTETHRKIEAMELREYELATAIAVPSLFVERSFLNRGISSKRLFRNGFGVDLDQFNEPEKDPVSPVEIGLKVVYAGALSIRKGIPDLLGGFQLAELEEASLTLIGGMTPELRNLVTRQGPSVKCLGHRPQSELAHHYGYCHCFVMASIEEGMAMVQMQALACGLPLICTSNTGGEDLLRLQNSEPIVGPHGVQQFPAGYLVPIHRPDAIAWCLRQLGSIPGLWEEKRMAALELAKEKLSWKVYGERAIQLYQELLSSK